MKWITNDVLPLIRQNNIYPDDSQITKLIKNINELEKKNKILLNDLKVEKFPEGAMVYIVEEYDIDNELYYRLGKTDDMNGQNKKSKIFYFTPTINIKNFSF
jgi:prophage antirepressor-like protein